MYALTYEGINQCIVGLATLLLSDGKERQTRGKTCFELPEPIVIKICQPTSRLVTISKRRWNKFLPFAEALWIASGCNDLDMIVNYLPKMKDFSDDGKFLRGAYGPRIRGLNNNLEDYKVGFSSIPTPGTVSIDQFKFVVDCFGKDCNTRQAVISIGDPLKDCYSNGKLKETKDFPCTRTIHFMKNSEGRLDLHVHMRSNDFLWGMTAVNVFNYTFILEYFSAILGIEIGSYYHYVNNLHYYEGFRNCLEELALEKPHDQPFLYKKSFNSFCDFAKKIELLSKWEHSLRIGDTNHRLQFNDDFFDDWAGILYKFNTKVEVEFINPVLQKLFEK